jgi:hypothetical protein
VFEEVETDDHFLLLHFYFFSVFADVVVQTIDGLEQGLKAVVQIGYGEVAPKLFVTVVGFGHYLKGMRLVVQQEDCLCVCSLQPQLLLA